MMKKVVFLLLFYCVTQISYSQLLRDVFINPTGTYVLKGEKYRGEIRGNYGEVRIKLLDDSTLAISMYGNKGYPDYSSASFTDTMVYVDNRAAHLSKSDPSCQLVFAFDQDGLNIKQIYTDPSSTCGFEKGAMPLGFIAKYSSDIPIIQPLARTR